MNNSLENEFEELMEDDYDEEFIPYEEEPAHIPSGYQPLKNTKKTAIATTSLTLAGLIATGLTVSAVIKRHKKPVEPETTSFTEVESTTELAIDHGNLILWEDFDIENADEVRKRAQAIYDISEKKYSVDEIVNMIYYFNDMSEKITFKNGASDEDKYKYLQNLAIHVADLLSNNIKDDLNRLYSLTDESNKEDDVLAKDDHEIYAYMFMPGNKNLVAETMTGEEVKLSTNSNAKGYAIALALEVDAQLDAIKDGNVSAFKGNAQSFYKAYEEILALKNEKDGHMAIMIYDAKKKRPLYGNNFTKEQIDKLDDTKQNNYLNSLISDASKKTGASYDANKGNKETTTPVTERVVATDRVDANKREETTRKFEKPVVIEKGGQKVTTSKQTIVTPGTTKVETYTFIAPTTKSSTTATTIIEKGGEVVSESYVDADALDAEKYANESVTKVNLENYSEPSTELDNQNNPTGKYVDADSTTFVIEEGGIRLS